MIVSLACVTFVISVFVVCSWIYIYIYIECVTYRLLCIANYILPIAYCPGSYCLLPTVYCNCLYSMLYTLTIACMLPILLICMYYIYTCIYIYIYVYLSPSIYFLCLNHCPWSICTFGSINVDVVSHRHRNCACLVTVRIPTNTVAAMSEQHRGRGNGRGSRANGPPLRVDGHHL